MPPTPAPAPAKKGGARPTPDPDPTPEQQVQEEEVKPVFPSKRTEIVKRADAQVAKWGNLLKAVNKYGKPAKVPSVNQTELGHEVTYEQARAQMDAMRAKARVPRAAAKAARHARHKL